MSENIRRVGRELKYKGAILDVYTDHMEFENGNKAEWDFIKHKGAAAVVAVDKDGRLIMVRQYRNALDRWGTWNRLCRKRIRGGDRLSL